MKRPKKHTKHLPRNDFAEAFGWFASASMLVAYGLLSFGVLGADSALYHGIFLVGSAGLAVVTYRHRAFQSFTVNVFFGILAFMAIIRTLYFA
ncbi:MAG: hypothetical protein V4678_03960 [Patescibacteria group bacterium]